MQTAKQRNRYILGLDGLRGLAVVAVVLYHLAPQLLPGGYIGVDIFFVISGFLITTLLIDERHRTGTINFKKFWMRRARRLLPALFSTIAIVSAIAFFIRGDILVGIGRQILGALTFSTNWVEIVAGSNYFDASNLHVFSNFWSLAVEEQFYLIWPLIGAGLVGLSFLTKRPKISSLLCLIFAASSAALMAFTFAHTANTTRVYYGTDTHFFGLMVGAALAFWMCSDLTKSRYLQSLKLLKAKRTAALVGSIGLAGLIVLLFVLPSQSSLTYSGGLPLASMLTAIVIITMISAPSLVRRLFTWRPLEWIGVRSYGIYLWHWPILVLLRYAFPATISPLLIGGAVTVLTLFTAATSFRYLETPIRILGLRAFMRRSIKRQEIVIDTAVTSWKLRPHPVLLVSLVILFCAVGAVVVAPSKTKAQMSVEAGQIAVARANQQAVKEAAAIAAAKAATITGANITVVGDSVALAAAPALEQQFPGILVDAEVSRSMRVGGFDTIASLSAAGNLRKVVVVALGTNGYYGTDNLDKLVTQLSGKKIVLVTSYADREWTAGNNEYVHQTAAKYPNVTIDDWNAAISSHPEDLVDGIHPDAAGGKIYADCLATAIAHLK